jgi:hypothetical protein
MPFTISQDPAVRLNSQKAFGRLRMLLRQRPLPLVDARAQARECGRCAYVAEMRLDMLVDVLAGFPWPDAHENRPLSESMTEAAVEAYLVAAEVPAQRPAGLTAA